MGLGRAEGAPAGVRAPHVLALGIRWPPETFIRRKLEGVAARGIRVTIASPRGRGGAGPAVPGVRVERVIPTGGSGSGLLGLLGPALAAAADLARGRLTTRTLAAARQPTGSGRVPRGGEAILRARAYARLASGRPDILQFEWLTAGVHYFSAIDALACPVLLTCRGSEVNVAPHAPTLERMVAAFPRLFERATGVACVSEALLTEAVVRYGLDPLKARVVRTGVDAGFFRPPLERVADDGAFRVVSVGVLRWLKGWEYALLTIAELARRGIPVSLDLFGGDPGADMATASDRDRIAHTIADLGLDDRVIVHGDAEPAGIRDALQRAHAFLHSSLSEGLPNVVLEAMACRVPVVATDVGGTCEAVTDGVEGFLVPPRDPRAAALALERLWREPGLRELVGAAGRARVEAEFTLEATIGRWLTFYEDVHRTGSVRGV